MGGQTTFYKKTIKDVPLRRHTVLVRADYNVPLDSAGAISDDLRIRASLPTLRYLLKQQCKVVIISHLGRPEGRDMSYSLEPIAKRLEELLGQDVAFVDQTVGEKVHQAVRTAPKSSVTLLENLRFDSGEEADDEAFAEEIVHSIKPDFFVQDGFGVVHRAHASTQAITLLVPSVAGLLLEKECRTIERAMERPRRPLVAVMGGAKVSDKITVIERFVSIADTIVIGGAMANTFLQYRGYNMGASKCEDGQKATLDALYAAAIKKVGADHVDTFIVLPRDVAVASQISPDAKRAEVAINAVPSDAVALDIGEQTIASFTSIVESARTVIWNGTLGYAELPEFAHG
ncbi:MAG: phosphoglycerate kinase, partial [Candidatus Saccharimonadales bacterium]